MNDDATEVRIDPEKIKEFSLNVWGYKQGEVVSLMIHIGDRLGLYQALNGAGPVTAAELAEKTGLKERWLLEWLRNQAAARLLDHIDGSRFELTPIGAAVLADEENSLAYAAGAFTGSTLPETVDKLVDAFRLPLFPRRVEQDSARLDSIRKSPKGWCVRPVSLVSPRMISTIRAISTTRFASRVKIGWASPNK